MNSTEQLAAQLTQLSDSLKGTNALITRLATIRFQPGSEPLAEVDTNGVRVELAQDIHESLKQLEEELELVKQEADDLGSGSTGAAGYRRRESTNDRDRERARVNAQVARLGEDLRSSRSQFRRAQLSAKKAAEAAKQKEREMVFASLQQPPPDPTSNEEEGQQPDGRSLLFAARRPHQHLKEHTEVDASASVTSALRRTHDLLSTELSRSQFARETLDQSTAALEELGEKYDSLDSILKGSKELLSTLVRSQKSDTWYLETAVYILATTLVWLFFRRILLGPFIRLPLFLLNWFIWKPLYLFLTLTGVITTEEAAAAAATTRFRTQRTSLIVQPSAAGKGGIPKFDENMAEQMRQRGGVPVGAGGAQAKAGKDGERVLDGETSEKIGKMAEKGQAQVRRADGTVLEDRGDAPRNPKKKVFEADVEDAKYEEQRRRERLAEDEGKDEL